MVWGKGKDPMWYSDGRPANEAAKREGSPPWLGKSHEEFQREEKEREKERLRQAEEWRKELRLRLHRRPPPKKPGGSAKPEAVVWNPDGSFRHAICECECGGGLVVKSDGEEISCHFCGATWTATLKLDPLTLELGSDASVNFFPASYFESVQGN